MQPVKSKIIYLLTAREDILNIARYHLEQVGPNSARKITNTIEQTINHLEYFPLMGQTHPDPVLAANGFRKIVVSSPYVCIYKVFDDTIYIYRIVNGKTDYPKLLR
jgi:toxin ParE1/3/4